MSTSAKIAIAVAAVTVTAILLEPFLFSNSCNCFSADSDEAAPGFREDLAPLRLVS